MRFQAVVRVSTALAFAGVSVAARRVPAVTDALTLAAIATVGIGHGAADDALLADCLASRGIAQRTIAFGYAAAAVAAFAFAMRAPRRAAVVLRALTWSHFGTGDVAFTRVAGGRRTPLFWMVSGGIPLGMGLASARRAGTCLALAVAALDAARGEWGAAADAAVPAVVFALCPRERTFAAYFAFWHAPRHVAIALERYTRGAGYRERLGRFARAAAPNAAIAIAAGGALLLAARGRRMNREAGILSITVPHLVAVAVLEALTA